MFETGIEDVLSIIFIIMAGVGPYLLRNMRQNNGVMWI